MEWLVAHKLFDDCMFVVQDHCVVFAKKDSSEDILSCSKLYIQRNIQEEKGIFYTTTTFTPHIAFSPHRAFTPHKEFTPKCGSTNLSDKMIHFVDRAVDFVENHFVAKMWRDKVEVLLC